MVLLTTGERGFLHQYVERFGVVAQTVPATKGKLAFYRANIKTLRAVIRHYKIEAVIAHQQHLALIAGLVNRFLPFKLIYVRHNSDEDYRDFPVRTKILNKLVNGLTPLKIAPSSVVKNFWITHEKAKPEQIRRINYGYDFAQYEKADPVKVEQIRRDFPAALLILSVARLVPPKRHNEMFSVVARLVKEGHDCKLVCLGSGPLEEELQKQIAQDGLHNHIFLLGQHPNVVDYLTAADVFLHLSSSEASNSAVKEAGLCKKAVIVCRGVGDFEDYIVNGENGFLVPKSDPAEETYRILKDMLASKINAAEAGERLSKTVTETFDIRQIEKEYKALLS